MMNRTMFELKRAGAGSAMQSIVTWAVILLASAGGIYVGYKIFGTDADTAPQVQAQSGQVGIDPDATRNKLRELSAVLVAADKKGDAELARTVLVHSVAVQVTIQHQSNEQQAALRNCALAVKHLLTGAQAIQDGGRWLNEDQFQAAAGDCRT